MKSLSDHNRYIELCKSNIALMRQRLKTWEPCFHPDLHREIEENMLAMKAEIEDFRNDWRLFDGDGCPVAPGIVVEIKCPAGSEGYGPARCFDWNKEFIRWWRPKR
ncbi:MAG TPA: hypothetical protein VHQ01_03125 [Pyrinomonadaceae bacterium]|jgi:hypothetical protein|nr:hypothetical protein [Pyrinomonadaceae bacterium]